MKTYMYAAALLSVAGSLAMAGYVPVDFSVHHNLTLNSGGFINGSTYPTGDQTLGGVPFAISSTGSIWYSGQAGNNDPQSIDVAVNLANVTSVHSLINTSWGERQDGIFASIEFFGSGGAYYKFDLDGNDDIRDYNFNPAFTTGINGVTTIEVFNNNLGQHLDKVQVDLPAAFASQTLSTIRYNDSGAVNFQRIFVAGITAEQVPAPGALAALGLSVLVAGRRRR